MPRLARIPPLSGGGSSGLPQPNRGDGMKRPDDPMQALLCYSVNRGAKPSSSASSSSAIMCRMLGRARPLTRRLIE